MADKMLALYEKEQSRSQEEVEDEYVMSFLSMAKRVNTLLNKRQKERVLQEVEEVVRREINKALDAEGTGNAAAGDAPRSMPPPPPVTPMPMASTSKILLVHKLILPLPCNVWTSTTIKGKSPLIHKLVSNYTGCRGMSVIFFIVQIFLMGNHLCIVQMSVAGWQANKRHCIVQITFTSA